MSHRRQTRRKLRCYYCLVPLVNPCSDDSGNHNHNDNLRTREHLIPIVDGGDDHPDNIRWACRACNNYVGCWSLEYKLRFRVFIRKIGSVVRLRNLHGRPGRSEVQRILDDMPSPTDRQSVRARKVALRIEGKNVSRMKDTVSK